MAAELPRLKAALEALGGTTKAPHRRRLARSKAAANGRGARRPRGANRDAILAVIGERPGLSVREVAAAVEQQGVKKTVTYTTLNKLVKDGLISKDDGSLMLTSAGAAT
jgi:hypothetical protein